MAVYTDVAAEDLGRFLAGYDIGELLSYKGIAEGVENSNFLVHTGSGHFILTLYERRVAERDLPFFLGLDGASGEPRHHLPAAGEKSRRQGAGQARRAARGRSSPSSTACGSAGRARRIARRSAKRWRGCISPAPIFRCAATTRCPSPAGGTLYEGCRERAHKVERNIESLVAAELDVLERDWPSGLPQGVIHADLFPDNVFFLGDKLSGLIDFYFACTDTLMYDVAICLNAWCFETGSFLQRHQGPRASCQLTPRRARCRTGNGTSCRCLARGAALRFLLTRLVDWLDVPPGALVRPKDPREYARKLRFHQKVKSVARLRSERAVNADRSFRMWSFTPTAPAPAIRGPAAGARFSLSAITKKSSKAARPTPPIIAWN